VLRVCNLNERLGREFLFTKVLLPAFGTRVERESDEEDETLAGLRGAGAGAGGRKANAKKADYVKDEAYWNAFILSYIGTVLYGSPYVPQGIRKSVP